MLFIRKKARKLTGTQPLEPPRLLPEQREQRVRPGSDSQVKSLSGAERRLRRQRQQGTARGSLRCLVLAFFLRGMPAGLDGAAIGCTSAYDSVAVRV